MLSALVVLQCISHPRSDPCCVFLPGLVVCTDIHSDNSTADTERNLCVPDERSTQKIILIRLQFDLEKIESCTYSIVLDLTLIQGVGKELVPEYLVQVPIRP